MSHKILIIDDEADIRDVLSDIFEDEGYAVAKAAHSEQAFAIIKKEKPDLIVLDIWLENSDMDGVGILKTLKKNDHSCKDVPVLMISGHGNIEMAVKAMKIGAYDFIEKPFKIEHILLTVQRALEQHTLKQENNILKDKINTASVEYHTKSPKLQSLLKTVADNHTLESRILITGEGGTGKSKFAHFIHKNSPRGRAPLHVFMAHELTPDLITHLFSDPDYAHTTILLEQIETMAKDQQSLLLKFLSLPESDKPLPRLICTASPNITQIIRDEDFSSALYDRIAVFLYALPALAERLDDFPDMITAFTAEITKYLRGTAPSFSSEAILILQNHHWRGNIRHLKVAIEWAVMNHMLGENSHNPISAKELSFLLNDRHDNMHHYDADTLSDSSGNQHSQTINCPETTTRDEHNFRSSFSMPSPNGEWLDLSLRDAREEFEKLYLSTLIKRFRGNISQMAGHIDMERTALHRKLKSMDIRYIETPTKMTERKTG